jgi:hypothetical protein
MRITQWCRGVTSDSSCFLVTGGLDEYGASRPPRFITTEKASGYGLARTLIYGPDAALRGGRRGQHRVDHADLRKSDSGSADGAGRPQCVREAEAAGSTITKQRPALTSPSASARVCRPASPHRLEPRFAAMTAICRCAARSRSDATCAKAPSAPFRVEVVLRVRASVRPPRSAGGRVSWFA